MKEEGKNNMADAIVQFTTKIDTCVEEECKKIKETANPRDEMNRYIKQIRWTSPELAKHLKKRMSNILNLDD